MPPCRTLATKAPPGARTARANSAAASARPTMRRWSVLRWPVAFAAMSDMTMSAGPPSISVRRSGAAASMKVERDELRSRQGLDRQEVDADDAPFPLRGANALCRDLRPAAGRGAEVDDALARLQQPVFVVDLDQLVGRPRAVALALGAGDVGVVELALEPALRGERCASSRVFSRCFSSRAPEPGLSLTRAPPRRQTPSSRIRFMRMPSRRPRSAMRRRSEGNARRIASRMAQPASTRSARSRPMQGFCGALVERRVEEVVENRGHMLVAHPHAVDAPPVVARQLEVDAADRGDGSRGAEQVELGQLRPAEPAASSKRRQEIAHLLDHGLERHPASRRRRRAARRASPRRPAASPRPGCACIGSASGLARLAVEPGDLGRAAADVEDDDRMGVADRRATRSR